MRQMNAVFALAFLVLLTLSASISAQTQVPAMLNYQGKLADDNGDPVADDTYTVQFRIYDQTSTERWYELHFVTTTDGLFSAQLGSQGSPLTEDVFDYAECWLGITVGADPELTPRQRLITVPYAHRVSTVDGAEGGTIISDLTITGSLSSVFLNTDLTGDESVQLPDDAVHSSEMFNEPGIASETNSDKADLNPYGMTDIETVSITIPSSGYILVMGQCYVNTLGSTNYNYIYVQIDETSGGSYTFPFNTRVGMATFPSVNAHMFPIFVQRIYYKSAGTHTFRLEGISANNDHTSEAWAATVTAQYIPTAYESIKSFVSSPDGFENAVPVQMIGDSDDPTVTETMYEVDLRELELRASRAREAALIAERDLLEARLRQKD